MVLWQKENCVVLDSRLGYEAIEEPADEHKIGGGRLRAEPAGKRDAG
jgi:hypothetical protein